MDKKLYLIKTLSRTKKKDYENFIINSIYARVNNLNLKPITQQYFKRTNGKYALVDLFFPQINMAIEIDEAHHKNQLEADKLRIDEILASLEANQDIKEQFFYRVDASRGLNEIDNQIQDIVDEINKRISLIDLKWNSFEQEIRNIKTKKILSVNDSQTFRLKIDVTNNLFDMNLKMLMQGGKKINSSLEIWFPIITKVNQEKSVSFNGYINYVDEQMDYIYEYNDSIDIEKRKQLADKYVQTNMTHVTFAKIKDPLFGTYYKFIGVYKFDGYKDDEFKTKIYKRIAKEYKFLD